MVVAQAGFGTAFLRSLLLPLVFLAPGVPALRLKRWAARRSGRPPRLQLIVYSTILSGLSLLTLYFGVSWLNWELVTVKTLNDLSLAQGVLLFVVHLGLTCVYGILAGEAQYNYYTGNRPRDLYDSWDFAFEKVYQGDDVVVKTTGGTWIRGRVVQSGSSEGTRDLLFESARALDAPEDGKTSVEPTQESTPQISYDEQEVLRATDSTDELSEMDQVVAEDSVETQAGNYVYIDGEDIETVVLCGGTDMNPEAEISDERNAAAQALVQEMTEGTLRPVQPLTNRLQTYDTVLLTLVFALLTAPVLLLSGFPSLLSATEFPLLCLGGLSAAVTLLHFRTTVSTLHTGRSLTVGSVRVLCVFTVLTSAVLVWYRPVTELVPLLSGVVTGTVFTTLHLGVTDEFDLTAASLSTVLGVVSTFSVAAWFEPWATEWVWRLVSSVWSGIVVLLAVDRLRRGTPSSYDRWPEVVKFASWWGLVVLISAALVVTALRANQRLAVVAVVFLVGLLFMRLLRQAVRRQLD